MEFSNNNSTDTKSTISSERRRSSQRKRRRPKCYACLTSIGDVNHTCSFGSISNETDSIGTASTNVVSSPVRKKARGVVLSNQDQQDDGMILCMDIDPETETTAIAINQHEVTTTSTLKTTTTATPIHNNIQYQRIMLPGNNTDKNRGPPTSQGPPKSAQDAPPTSSLAPPPMMTASTIPNMRHLHSRSSVTTINALNEEKKKRPPAPNFAVFVPNPKAAAASSSSAAPQQQQSKDISTPMVHRPLSSTAPDKMSFRPMQQQQQHVPFQSPQGSGFGQPSFQGSVPSTTPTPSIQSQSNPPSFNSKVNNPYQSMSSSSSSGNGGSILESSWLYTFFITTLLFSQSFLTGYNVLQISSNKMIPMYVNILQKFHSPTPLIKENTTIVTTVKDDDEADENEIELTEQKMTQTKDQVRLSYIQRKAREIAAPKIMQHKQEQQNEEEESMKKILQSSATSSEETDYEALLSNLDENLENMEEILNEWEYKLSDVEHFNDEFDLSTNDVYDAIQKLQEISDKPIPLPFHLSNMPIPWKNCPNVPIESSSLNFLTRQDYNILEEEIKDLLNAATTIIENNVTCHEQFSQWILDQNNEFNSNASSANVTNHKSEQQQQEVISLLDMENKLDAYQSKQDSRIDYASPQYGAKIMLSKTSSTSLVNTLPLWNKILHKLNLRFYGYGPTMALQHSSLIGQCWSFTKDSKSNFGYYATLNIKLSKAINVTSVTLYHPQTNQMENAVQKFRLSCSFKNDDGGDDAISSLGTFQYDIHSMFSKQEFFIDNDTDNECDQLIVGIDSNWGGIYTSFYKIGVFGNVA